VSDSGPSWSPPTGATSDWYRGPGEQHTSTAPGGGPPPRPAAPARPRGPASRWVWIAVVGVLVALLIGSHRITGTEVLFFCILMPSLVLHELAHGAVALACGDDTAKRAGRLTLNPLAHIDLAGTIIVPALMILGGWGFFGWAKPVPVDLRKLRSPRNQGVLVSLAGPATNLVLAGLAGACFVLGHGATAGGGPGLTTWAEMLFDIGLVNLWVAAFNLLPIPPLDGSVLIERILPASWWPGYLRIRPMTLPVLFGAFLFLAMLHVYPTAPLLNGLERWWGELLGVQVVW
jgi:Zn-dependent protease